MTASKSSRARAARAAARASAAEGAHLLALAESLRASAGSDSNAYLVLNARYHATIYALARHATAAAILERLANRPVDLFFPQPFRSMPLTDWVDAHVEIALAIAAGDGEAAGAGMYEHMSHLIERLRGFESRGERPS